MNERIQELARQANGVFIHKLMTGAKQYTFLEYDLEKFAELIVQECVNCCDEVDRLNKAFIKCYDFDPQNGPKECIQAIKQHFGVEE